MASCLCLGSRGLRESIEAGKSFPAEFWSVNTAMIENERRTFTRKTLNPLPFINLPSDNGGIVLDVSEQGLRFRAVAPVEQTGPILFWFTAHSNLIAGIADLVWLDETRKTGGLRFTQLPYNAREQIRSWPADPNLRPSIGEDMTLHIAAPSESGLGEVGEREFRAARAVEPSRDLDRLLPGSFGTAPEAEQQFSAPEEGFAESTLMPIAAWAKANRESLLKAGGALVLVLVLSVLGYSGHRRAGELLIELGTRMSGEAHAAAAAPIVVGQNSHVEGTTPEPPTAVSVIPSTASAAAPAATVPAPVLSASTQTVASTAGSTPVPRAERSIASAPAAAAVTEKKAPARKLQPSGTELIVQVAALSAQSDADEMVTKLKNANFQAVVRTLPVDSLYRVTLGPYSDEASAHAVIEKLKKAGFSSFLRREAVTVTDRLG
jgi:cell division septation protein DedD